MSGENFLKMGLFPSYKHAVNLIFFVVTRVYSKHCCGTSTRTLLKIGLLRINSPDLKYEFL